MDLTFKINIKQKDYLKSALVSFLQFCLFKYFFFLSYEKLKLSQAELRTTQDRVRANYDDQTSILQTSWSWEMLLVHS